MLNSQTSQVQLEYLRSSLLHSLPHELRSPLAHIMGFLEILIDDFDHLDRDSALDMLQSASRAAGRLGQIVENCVIYAEVEVLATDVERLAEVQTDITPFADSLIRSTCHNRALRYQRSDDLMLNLAPVDLRIHDRHLRQMVEQLVDNAFKFSQPGQPVRVEGYPGMGGYHLHITDEGRGMSPQQVEFIGAYTQFERHRYEQNGLGLGLIIAKRVVEVYQGKFGIESASGQGTACSLVLPVY